MAEPVRKEPADVLVIGSGASGAIASMVLGQAGLDVVCLEQGGWTLPEDHPHMSPDWEWQRQKRWHPNNNIRQGRDDFPVESASSNILMWNAVGGSTNVYTALWPRYRPSDFRKGVEHGLAPDWPIAYEDLAPYYDRVDRIVGVSGLAGNPAMPPHEAYPTPPLPLRPVGRQAGAGVRPARLALVADPGGRGLRGLRRPPRLQRLLGLRGRLRARLDEQVLALGLAEGARGGGRPAPLRAGRAARARRGRAHFRRGLRRPPQRRSGTSRRPTWSSSPATASARRASC